ncbi:MAG: STY4526/YPO1902 family pathogenicity island replication protein [Burkholderiaceae bacterium]
MPGLVDDASHEHVVRRLRALSWRELVLLARSGQPKVQLHLDAEHIDRTLRMIRHRLDREDCLDFFIEHGATTAMLRRLFRLPVAQIKARRARLLGAHRQRRPALPKAAARDAVHRAWRRSATDGAANLPRSTTTCGCTASSRSTPLRHWKRS